MSRRPANPTFSALGTTIFTVMSALAVKHNAINLGQGFPDEDGPSPIREAAAHALRNGPNQYPPMRGVIQLRKAIAEHAQRFYDLKFDPETEVLVTSGGTEALTDCILALIAPGDEAIVIEPTYDSYRPILDAAGAIIRTVRLEPPHFRVTEAALTAAFSPKTKLIIINSPLNPMGRVFCRDELELLAQFVKRFDTYAICDEVYEHLVFDGRAHIPLISLDGMRERCLRVGSAGKMFSLTGWKIGWVTGDAPLVEIVAKAHQFNTFTTSPALQLGIAHGLQHEMGYALEYARALQEKRDFLAIALKDCGFGVQACEGTYFLVTSITGLTNEPDRDFAMRLTREAGVAAIPISAFFANDGPSDLIRFAFCKKQTVLADAASRLKSYFGGGSNRR